LCLVISIPPNEVISKYSVQKHQINKKKQKNKKTIKRAKKQKNKKTKTKKQKNKVTEQKTSKYLTVFMRYLLVKPYKNGGLCVYEIFMYCMTLTNILPSTKTKEKEIHSRL
jgi:Na+/glutamate symporter